MRPYLITFFAIVVQSYAIDKVHEDSGSADNLRKTHPTKEDRNLKRSYYCGRLIEDSCDEVDQCMWHNRIGKCVHKLNCVDIMCPDMCDMTEDCMWNDMVDMCMIRPECEDIELDELCEMLEECVWDGDAEECFTEP